MRALLLGVGLSILMWSAPARAWGQDATTRVARPGDQVRIWSGGHRPWEGILRHVARESVFVQLPGGATTGIAHSNVTRVQVSAGWSFSGGAKRGTKFGAIVGVLAGLYLATGYSGCYSDGKKVPCSQLVSSPSVGERIFAVTLTAGVGAVAGSALGLAFPVAAWHDASLQAAEAVTTRSCGGLMPGPVAVDQTRRPSCSLASRGAVTHAVNPLAPREPSPEFLAGRGVPPGDGH